MDPRSAMVRKLAASETEGEELPFGWEQAEAPDGRTYYIDHNSGVCPVSYFLFLEFLIILYK